MWFSSTDASYFNNTNILFLVVLKNRVFFFFIFAFMHVQDEWVVCKVHHKGGEEASSKKAGGGGGEEHYSSAGTPNVSSVEAGEGGDEFLVDSLLDYSSYFNSSLPLTPSTTTTTISAAAPPYNADLLYPVHTTTAAAAANAGLTTTTTTTSSRFVGLPTDGSNYSQHAAAVANSVAAATKNNDDDSSASWNMLRHAADNKAAMGTNYSLHHQAMVAKVLGSGCGVSPNFGAGLPPAGSSVAAAGIIAQNNVVPQQRLAGNYRGNYAAGYHTSK